MRTEKTVDTDEIREKTLEVTRRHRASWIELGQYLYAIYKDKLYRNWDFATFETYCAKELRIKQQTAVKLLKSYHFLEQEKPELVREAASGDAPEAAPNYESVNVLRLAAQNKKLSPSEVSDIRRSVFEGEKEPKDVRAQMKRFLSEKDEKDPRELKRERRTATLKRLITVLSGASRECESSDLLPGYLLKQMKELISKLEDQLE